VSAEFSIVIKDVPPQPGCLSVLMHVENGGAVDACDISGNTPISCQGAKWCDVRTWFVVVWFDGMAFCCAGLKTETPEPWSLANLLDHCARHPARWQQVKTKQGEAK
jgi:hypothetical protein